MSTPSYWRPSIGMSMYYQLDGPQLYNSNASIINYPSIGFEFDPFRLKAMGKRVICYVNVGSLEEEDNYFDTTKFPANVLGNRYPGWNERFLDIRSPTVRNLIKDRFVKSKNMGCDGIDPDNSDSYLFNTGFSLTHADAANYVRWVSETVHSLNMSVGLKNSAGLMSRYPDLIQLVDFGVVEECYSQRNCGLYTPLINARKPVFAVEYTDQGEGGCDCIEDDEVGFACQVMSSFNFEGFVTGCMLDGGDFKYCSIYDSNGLRDGSGGGGGQVSSSTSSAVRTTTQGYQLPTTLRTTTTQGYVIPTTTRTSSTTQPSTTTSTTRTLPDTGMVLPTGIPQTTTSSQKSTTTRASTTTSTIRTTASTTSARSTTTSAATVSRSNTSTVSKTTSTSSGTRLSSTLRTTTRSTTTSAASASTSISRTTSTSKSTTTSKPTTSISRSTTTTVSRPVTSTTSKIVTSSTRTSTSIPKSSTTTLSRSITTTKSATSVSRSTTTTLSRPVTSTTSKKVTSSTRTSTTTSKPTITTTTIIEEDCYDIEYTFTTILHGTPNPTSSDTLPRPTRTVTSLGLSSAPRRLKVEKWWRGVMGFGIAGVLVLLF
ncbi:hypothetical protein HDV05_005507 [Chytridiales sp. JEL 0842]|nr:hypothetical protein HDV05_005507 [Chytridiales sp. JEL 0842]